MDERVYWIWLQQALKYGNYKIKYICDLYKNNIENFFESGEQNWRLCGFLTNNDICALNSSSIEDAQRVFDQCYRLSYDIVVPTDDIYPESLFAIANPPAVLYILGDKSILKPVIKIAVVGTRSASIRSCNIAEEISYHLSGAGATVVSGGALGIDSAAHQGAIKAKKATIGVLGCGINFNYLSQNSKLRYQISQNGALISEYPPDHPAYNYNFPIRNRIISGLSVATIVVEAGKQSGSLITANLANDQGRDVYVVPSGINDSFCSGAQALIDDGAKILTHPSDLVEYYNTKYYTTPPLFKKKPDTSNNTSETNTKGLDLTDDAKLIYDFLSGHRGKLHIDRLVNLLGLETKRTFVALTELELYNLISKYPGQYYSILN